MNAVEFVKKFGICEAQSVLLKSQYHNEVDVYLPDMKEFTYIAVNPADSCPYVGISDLKQIVDAFELISSFGTIEEAKEYEQLFGGGIFTEAINLVEQCNA